MWARFVEIVFRSRKGTVQDLADTIKVSRRTLYNLKSGAEHPNWGTIQLLAEYQGLEAEDFVAYVKSIG